MDYQPTPPPKNFGPLITVDVDITSTGDLSIYPGWFNGIPQYWRLVDAYLTLTADANVANRYITVDLLRSKIDITQRLDGYKCGAITASQSKKFSITNVSVLLGTTTYTQGDFTYGLNNQPIYIYGDNVLKIYIGAGQAGDVLSGVVRLSYQNRKLGMPTPYDE